MTKRLRSCLASSEGQIFESLADLSLEQMRDFIDRILELHLHERGLDIIIDPAEKNRRRKKTTPT